MAMQRQPERKLAAHVQAAIAAGQAKMGAQTGGPTAVRRLAPHVQAAVAAGQAKVAGAPQAARQAAAFVAPNRGMAPHVRRAVAAAAQARMQPAPQRTPGAPQASPRSSTQPKHAPRVVQPADIRQRYDRFEEKRKKMMAYLEAFSSKPGEQIHSDQSALDGLADEIFSGIGSRETGAVAVLGDGRILVASQSGRAASAAAEGKLSDAYIAADAARPQNMHAEMILLYYAYRNGLEGEISAIGVAGDKGCCRLCSAMLASEGIAFTKTGASRYEIQWQDPIDAMNKFGDAVWGSQFGEGSGVSSMERKLLSI